MFFHFANFDIFILQLIISIKSHKLKSKLQMYRVKKICLDESIECHEIDLLTNKLWSLNQWKKELRKKYVYPFACFNNNRIIGVCVFQIIFSVAEITYFAIHPIHKRKGLGTTLLKETLKQLKTFTLEKIILEVSEKNIAARGFYHSFGFETICIRKNYYRDGSNALLQEKKLLKK